MIPAINLMLAAYIVARMVDVMGREGVPAGVYYFSLAACLIAMGVTAYVFIVAQRTETVLEGLGF